MRCKVSVWSLCRRATEVQTPLLPSLNLWSILETQNSPVSRQAAPCEQTFQDHTCRLQDTPRNHVLAPSEEVLLRSARCFPYLNSC